MLSPPEQRLLARVETELAEGLALNDWWQREGKAHFADQRFELIPATRRQRGARGFCGQADIPGLGSLPVMGSAQEIFFTRPKARPGNPGAGAQDAPEVDRLGEQPPQRPDRQQIPQVDQAQIPPQHGLPADAQVETPDQPLVRQLGGVGRQALQEASEEGRAPGRALLVASGISAHPEDPAAVLAEMVSRDWRPVGLRPKTDVRALVAVSAPSDLAEYKLAGIHQEGEIGRARSALEGIDVDVLGGRSR